MNINDMEFWWWAISRIDFDIITYITKLTNAKHILEFWPGVSTYAFIQWWANFIHSYEDDPNYLKKYTEEFKWYPGISIIWWSPYDEAFEKVYDIAFVDGPKWKDHLSRIESLQYAVLNSKLTILHDSKRIWESESLALLKEQWYDIYTIDTEVWLTFISKQS